MDDKQTFDALLELAKFRRDRLFERSKREDRTSFAVWAILIGAIISLRPRPNDWLLMAMLFVIVAVYAVFVIEVWARNRHNGDEAKYYVYCAERLFAPDAPEPGPRPDYRTHLSFSGRDWRLFFTRDFWWSGMEITFTAALAVLAYFLIGGTCARLTRENMRTVNPNPRKGSKQFQRLIGWRLRLPAGGAPGNLASKKALKACDEFSLSRGA